MSFYLNIYIFFLNIYLSLLYLYYRITFLSCTDSCIMTRHWCIIRCVLHYKWCIQHVFHVLQSYIHSFYLFLSRVALMVYYLPSQLIVLFRFFFYDIYIVYSHINVSVQRSIHMRVYEGIFNLKKINIFFLINIFISSLYFNEKHQRLQRSFKVI